MAKVKNKILLKLSEMAFFINESIRLHTDEKV